MVIDTVPVSGASVSPGSCALPVSKTPPTVSVTTDDSGVTTTTVPPHINDPLTVLSGAVVAVTVASVAPNSRGACCMGAHTSAGAAPRIVAPKLGAYVISVGATAGPPTFPKEKYGCLLVK